MRNRARSSASSSHRGSPGSGPAAAPRASPAALGPSSSSGRTIPSGGDPKIAPMRLGVTPPVELAGVAAAIEVAAEAEGLGYPDVFSSEAGHADAFTPLAALAGRTSTIRLGTALVPVFTRPPALLAMTAAAMQAATGGRFVLGMGTSTQHIVERWMGLEFEHPVERVRDYVHALRRILRGEQVSFEGETVRIDGFRSQVEPVSPVPIHVGAL